MIVSAQVSAEAAQRHDMVMLTHILEDYYQVTHQTLDMHRFAAVDPVATHLLKVGLTVLSVF
jgi:hypothetical protein